MKYVGRFNSYIERQSFWLLWAEFLAFYTMVALLFAVCYRLLPLRFEELVMFKQGPLSWSQAVYFSFITQLTVGYGDYAPMGWGQFLAVAQAVLGVGLFGIWAGLAVAKMLSAHPDSIRFAPWAGYDLETQTFFVIFVNRNVEYLVNVNITRMLKFSNHNTVDASASPAYIGRSTWSFTVQEMPIKVLETLDFEPGDGIKFGISGKMGFTPFTAWRKYPLNRIYVVPDRRFLSTEIHDNPKLDKEYYASLNKPPAGAEEFLKYFSK